MKRMMTPPRKSVEDWQKRRWQNLSKSEAMMYAGISTTADRKKLKYGSPCRLVVFNSRAK